MDEATRLADKSPSGAAARRDASFKKGVLPWGLNGVAAAAIAVFLSSLLYYGLCLFPGLGGELNVGDSTKFQILGHTQILVHGPGYPLVLLIGAGLRLLALPLPPWWVLTFTLSAIPAAFANTVAFLIVQRLTRSVTFGLAGAIVLGSAGLPAVQATEAEVYSLTLAFVLITLYLLIVFSETKRLPLFLAACTVYAVSFGNHLMMIMLVPVFIWVTLAHRRIVLRPLPIAIVALIILLGASQYLYLAYVVYHPDTAYSEYLPLPPQPMELIRYIMGSYFGDLFGSGLATPQTLMALIGTLRSAHPWISMPLIALGVLLFIAGWRRRDTYWNGLALVYGGALAFIPFTIWYGAYDIQAFHLPVLGTLLIGSVATLGWWLRGRPRLLSAVAMMLLVVGAVRAAQTASVLSAREPVFDGLRPALESIMAQSPVENPIVAMTYGIRMAVLYYEVQGKVPAPATYRVRWRALADTDHLSSIGGIVMPTDGDQFVEWVEHQRPDLRCRTEEIRQPVGTRWPAYAFQCEPPR